VKSNTSYSFSLLSWVKNAAWSAFFFFALLSSPSRADDLLHWMSNNSAMVPFIFSTESMGTTIGMAGVIKGVGQPQAALIGVGLISDKGSYATYIGSSNYLLGDSLLIGGDFYSSEYKSYSYYLGDQGSSSSSGDDFTLADGKEEQLRFSVRYILPFGSAKDGGAKSSLNPRRLVTGWNPVESGVSTIEFQPFYKSRDLGSSQPSHEATETWGTQLLFDWDNRNDLRNPTHGAHSTLTFSYAPEQGEESQWWTWEFAQSAFYDLGSLGDLFDQQVLAFNFYTADTPSWDSNSYDGRPPEYAGINLGGLYRLRSFQSGRFHDRSAIAYSLEYRVMPDWQPLDEMPIIGFYDMPWWQWVVFTDLGQVSESYNLTDLHEEMSWSAGAAIRFQVEGVVVRTELAWGNEGDEFRVMINQPF
jgi:outer membrane protein assembly factor BamA